MMIRGWLMLAALTLPPAQAADTVYQTPVDFLREVYHGTPPEAQVMWITAPLRPAIRAILAHDLDALRVRYWVREGRTAWILEEIGKERPITLGIVVHQDHIERLDVLVYRESRGMEVRQPVFTDQFKGAILNSDQQLNRPIDGISGASLSVRALTRLARLALYLTRETTHATP